MAKGPRHDPQEPRPGQSFSDPSPLPPEQEQGHENENSEQKAPTASEQAQAGLEKMNQPGAKPLTPEQATEITGDSKTVPMYFPRKVTLQVLKAGVGRMMIHFKKGPNDVPVEFVEHQYLKDAGMTDKAPTVEKK